MMVLEGQIFGSMSLAGFQHHRRGFDLRGGKTE